MEDKAALWQQVGRILSPHLPEDRRTVIPTAKNLLYRVQSLNRCSYAKVVQPNRSKYYATLKADGFRALLLIEGATATVLTDEITGTGHTISLSHPVGATCLLEAESINLETYHVYDILFGNGEECVSKTLGERMSLMEQVVREMQCDRICLKQHYPIQGGDLSHILTSAKAGRNASTYKVDGVILTENAPYYRSQVFKWKPAQQSTVDVILIPYRGPRVQLNTYIACASINPHKAVLMKTGVEPHIVRFVKSVLGDDNGYMPLWHPMFPSAYYVELGEHAIPEELPPDSPIPLVCEMGVVGWNGIYPQWEFVRCRSDKSQPNNLEVCWQTLWQQKYPLDLDVVLGTDAAVESYFQVDNTEEQPSDFQAMLKAMNDVKFSILHTMANNRRVCVDLGCGRGQDIFKYMGMKIDKVVGVDADVVALMQYSERYLVGVDPMTKKPSANKDQTLEFRLVHSDLLTTPAEQALKSIFAVTNNESADIVICNFACHYFCESRDSIINFVYLLKRLLRDSRDKFGGRVILTFPCGRQVHKLLKEHHGEWNCPPYHDKVKYDYTTCEDADGFPPIGSRYCTKLPFSAGELYEEPLVHTGTLQQIMAKNGFAIEKLQSLAEIAQEKCKPERKEKLTPQDWAHLNKYVVLMAQLPKGRY